MSNKYYHARKLRTIFLDDASPAETESNSGKKNQKTGTAETAAATPSKGKSEPKSERRMLGSPTSAVHRLHRKVDSYIVISDENPKKPKERRKIKSGTSASVDPSRTINKDDTLPDCKTIDEVRQWLNLNHQVFAEKAMGGIERRKVAEESRSMLQDLLTKPSATAPCIMTNPRLVTDAFEHLRKALYDAWQADPPTQMALVTLIAGDCETSSDKPVIDLNAAQKRAKSTFRAMSKDYIAVTEFSQFGSIQHADGGFTINHHEHAIIFGDLSKASRMANKHRRKYPTNSTGADPIVITPITDPSEVNMARMAAYLLKAPSKAINYCPPIDNKKGFINKSEKGDRNIRFLRMAQLLTMMTLEECFYAGGKGLDIRKALVGVLRALSASDAPPTQRLIHPDAIPSFWEELVKELRRDRWRLPVIMRRP